VAILVAVASILVIHRLHVDAPTGHGYMNSDLDRQYYPNAVFLHGELREGRFPLWNPYQAAGQPFVALHQPAAFYPPNLAALLLFSPEQALALQFALHVFLAGLFTWLFARRLGLGPPSSLAAAFCFMLSPTEIHAINIPPFHATEVWLPAILWTTLALVQEARLRWALGLAASLALAFLGGHAQGFVYELQLAILYGLFTLLCVAPRGRRLRVVALALLAGVLAAGFAAPQWLSALELAQLASRNLTGLSHGVAAKGSIAPQELLHGLSPLLGSAGQVSWVVKLPYLAAPLFVLGLAARRQRAHWAFFAAAALLSGLFMIGPESVVWEWYYRLPGGALFRIPMRMAFVYMFVCSMLIAIGIEGVSVLLSRISARLAVLRLGAGAALVGVLLLIAGDVYSRARFFVDHPVLSGPHSGAPPRVGVLSTAAGNPSARVRRHARSFPLPPPAAKDGDDERALLDP